jgi:L(+)-tartrate dehydratase beta subunit
MKKILTTPIDTKEIESLNVGDIVYLNGTLVTGRDDVVRRVVVEGMQCPVDMSKAAQFHAGPIVRESGNDLECIAVGPTSSIRMEAFQDEFIRKTGLKLIIGKGGMGDKTAAACKKYKCIHCVAVGGAAVALASHVEKIEDVKWRELGMPEAMWIFKVKNFGPLIVSIDTKGNNMFTENKKFYTAQKEICKAPIIESVKDYQKVE